MNVENAVDPGSDQIPPFLALSGPVFMVNLLKFHEKAHYPDGRDPDLSGAAAYARYGEAMRKLLEANGGGIVFMAKVEGLLLGKVDELWDAVGIAEYPSAAAMIKIASSQAFKEIEVHRRAGLAGQLNITTSNRPIAELE